MKYEFYLPLVLIIIFFIAYLMGDESKKKAQVEEEETKPTTPPIFKMRVWKFLRQDKEPEWWTKRHEEYKKKRRFWFLVLLIASMLIAIPFGYLVAMIFLVSCGHVIALVYDSKDGVNGLLWFFVVGMSLFIVTAGFVPEVVNTRDSFYRASRKFLDDKTKLTTIYFNEYTSGIPSTETMAQDNDAKARVEVFLLTKEWKSFVPLHYGEDVKFECVTDNAELRINFKSANKSVVDPGQIVPCPTRNTPTDFIDIPVDPVYSFRSSKEEVSLRIYNAKQL